MWLEAKFKIKSEDVELFEAILLMHDIDSWESTGDEALRQMDKNYDYINSELEAQTDNVIKIILSDDDEGRALLAAIEAASGVQAEQSLQDEKEWSEEWKKYYKPMDIGERLCVCPAWEDYEAGDRILCRIEPGAVFGTGLHDTTRLCLEFLDDIVNGGEEVVDIGCGSGILGIASLLLGAKTALGIDIEEAAREDVLNNAAMNGVAANFDIAIGDILSDEQLRSSCGKYDIVIANIVADVIIALAPLVKEMMKQDAYFVASGIIDTKLDEVCNCLKKENFSILAVKESDNWRSLLLKVNK